MKTFIEIMKWVGGGTMICGLVFAIGMIRAEGLYRTALGYDAYLDLNAISLWNVLGIFVVGSALAITFGILAVVFESGERSAVREEQEDEL